MKAKGLNFEIIFASSDKDEAAFKEYFGEMPWLALPHGDKRKEQWSNLFGVSGIPSLAIVDAEGNTITKDGRSAVASDPEGDAFPWHPKPVKDAANPSGIDESPSIVVFMETQPAEEQAKITAQMTEVAQKYIDKAKAAKEDPKYLFFAATNGNGPVPKIRSLTKQEAIPESSAAAAAPKPPVAVLLNLDDNGAYYEMKTNDGEGVTTANLEKFITDFEASALERKQCGE